VKKKVFLIIGGVLLLCLVAGLCLYLIPQDHRNLNTTLQATKLDKDGNILGTEEIAMQGIFRDYRFQEDTVELSIAPFGIFKSIVFSGDSSWNKQSALSDIRGEFYQITFSAWNTSKDDYDFCTITTSRDFEYWVFHGDDNGQPIYYIASASGERTVEEIVQFFRGFAPGYKPS
jgi:hypothetical protein